MSRTLRVVAHIPARQDTIEAVRSVLLGLIEPTRAEDGCIVYELLQNDADPTDFTFVEEWTDRASLEAHLASPHVQAALAKVPDLLSGEPDIRTYALIA